MDLSQLLDSLAPEALTVDKQPTGYTASIFYGMESKWSPREFASTASEAIEKALRLHAEKRAPVPICPPPY